MANHLVINGLTGYDVTLDFFGSEVKWRRFAADPVALIVGVQSAVAREWPGIVGENIKITDWKPVELEGVR